MKLKELSTSFFVAIKKNRSSRHSETKAKGEKLKPF